MAQLNQIIAVTNGKKNQVKQALTELYKTIQKPDLFNGLTRTYRPLDDEGELMPAETKKVQHNAEDMLTKAASILTDLFDVVATQDVANTIAKHDIEVDGKVILADVPVTYMLFLEKQLGDVRTFVEALPVLDNSEDWEQDTVSGNYRSAKVTTNRSKKVPKSHVLYEATKEHPAQVQAYTEDIKVGEWDTFKFSGALSQPRKQALLSKVDKLINAVKFAREKANCTEVTNTSVGKEIFNYVFN